MAAIPSVPTFTAGTAPSAATLNALGYAVQFALTPPRAVLQQTNVAPVSGGQAVAITTDTAIIWTVAVQSDAGWASGNPSRYTAQTPGYYRLDAVWQATAETTASYRGARFRVTTGANNPGGAGLVSSFGSARLLNVTSATGVNYTAIGCSMISPLLYIADYVELIAYAGHAETTGFTDGGSWMTTTLVSL